MAERLYGSVEELFKEVAPDLLEFLSSDDIFWLNVKDNSISDKELDGHLAFTEQIGMTPESSAVARAVQIIQDHRHFDLVTPMTIRVR